MSEGNENLIPEPEAHDMANEMKGWLRSDIESVREAGEVTASRKSYEKAFQVVQELRTLAKEEGFAEEVAFKAGRLLHKLAKIPGMAIYVADAGVGAWMAQFSITAQGSLDRGGPMGLLSEFLEEMDAELSRGLADPASKLSKVHGRGEKIASIERGN